MCEECCNLVPAPLGFDPLQVEGLGDGLTGYGRLQGYAPWVERRLHPWRVSLRRASLQIVRVGEEGSDGRGQE